MMLDHALALAARGFHVFPLIEGGKLPLIEGWQEKATRDADQIRAWWLCPVLGIEQPWNIGICTTRFGDNESLVVVDIDNKGDKHGDDEILRLELDGLDLPATYQHSTPSGGRHLVYRHGMAVKQGVDVLGPGLDVRARGGFVVAAPSQTSAGQYTAEDRSVAQAPAWLIDRCGRAPDQPSQPLAPLPENIDPERARQRAIHYLANEAPLAVEGAGGDATTFRVAARLKDFGVAEAEAVELMSFWNERCSPPWTPGDLIAKVHNAYRYGNQQPGNAAPETIFAPVEIANKVSTTPDNAKNIADSEHVDLGPPVFELNKEYAFVLAGGGHHILWETTDHKARYQLVHLSEESFHKHHASRLIQTDSSTKLMPLTKHWMGSKERRSYRGICFMPGLESPDGFYNLWRGFAVEPAEKYVPHPAVEAWLEHLRENVCRGDATLAHWLTSYFAQLVQRPWDKPLVAVVLRGGKGVGKNALIDRVGHLLGHHYLLTSNRRYLVSNFNGHLENLLLFALDEAFWSGDKQAEGILKDLITGATHEVEHKGKEPYKVENRCRVFILGNEEWLAPASNDERRFAVFDVGEGRKQDRGFFARMREGMEAGGYRAFLRYLLDYDCTGADLNEAPATDALLDQKHATLEPFHQWWLDCLSEGTLVGNDFGATVWPPEVEKARLRSAFNRYVRDRNIRTRAPDERMIGRILKKCAPSVNCDGKRREGTTLVNVYKMGDLATHRKEWEAYIGHKVEWAK